MGKFYKRSLQLLRRFLKNTRISWVILFTLVVILFSSCKKSNEKKYDLSGNWWHCLSFIKESPQIYTDVYFVNNSISVSFDVIDALFMSKYRLLEDNMIYYGKEEHMIYKKIIKKDTPEILTPETSDNHLFALHKINNHFKVLKLLSGNEEVKHEFINKFYSRRDSLRKNRVKKQNVIFGNWWSCENYGINDTNRIYVESYFMDDSVCISYDIIAGLVTSHYFMEGDTLYFYNAKDDYYINKFFVKQITPDLLELESVYNYKSIFQKINQNIDVSRLLSKNEKNKDDFIKNFYKRRASIKKQCKK